MTDISRQEWADIFCTCGAGAVVDAAAETQGVADRCDADPVCTAFSICSLRNVAAGRRSSFAAAAVARSGQGFAIPLRRASADLAGVMWE
ncbi:hypothetical protein ACFJIW_06155 [Tahibacter sp. UC22_41]|uniref:hypothetical protein n=1 Tax=Tahibacter sp. UC22_41 TaxID=3350178 RepID=UPI0036DB4BBB